MTNKVADAIDVPLIVWGTANHDKDTEVLRKVAEVCQDKSLILGPVEEGDHKKIGAAAIGYKHTVVASSPIDINLAKQLNIPLGNLGVPDQRFRENHPADPQACKGEVLGKSVYNDRTVTILQGRILDTLIDQPMIDLIGYKG